MIRNNLPRDLSRVEKLIIETLGRMKRKDEFHLFGKAYNGDSWSSCYGFEIKDDWCVISAMERGEVYPITFFYVRDLNSAARYFVWKVSKGEVEINWELFL